MLTAFTIVSFVLAIVGYLLFVFSLFPGFVASLLSRPFDALKKRYLLGGAAVVVPLLMLLAMNAVARDVGVVFAPGDQEYLLGWGLFPAICGVFLVPVKIIVLFIDGVIKHFRTKKPTPENDMTPQSSRYAGPMCGCGLSGCLIPLLFFICISIILIALGDNDHIEYNPYMDGPRNTYFLYGIDWILFCDALRMMGFFAASLIVLLFLIVWCFDTAVFVETTNLETKIPSERKMSWFNLVFFVIFIAGSIIYPIFFMDVPSRYASAPLSCERNMKMIVLSLLSYKEKYGNFPPPYTVDANGQPLHSWRVLVLPFIERKSLYEQIRLGEPWDSEHNKRFHYSVPVVFQCPELFKHRKIDAQKSLCDYALIVGQESEPNEFLLVERKTSVNWMEPTEELTPQNMSENLGKNHNGKAHAVLTDGKVMLVDELTY